jgi:hypothetical protein
MSESVTDSFVIRELENMYAFVVVVYFKKVESK